VEPVEQREHERAARDTNAGEGGRVDRMRPERQAAEQRVGSKRDQRGDGKKDGAADGAPPA
jgi:hypothetical protein